MKKNSLGFSLVELLAVIAVVGILAAIIMVVTVSVRQTARKAQCASNLRQIGAATQLHIVENNEFPPARVHSKLMPYLDMTSQSFETYWCPEDSRIETWESNLALPTEEQTHFYIGDYSSYSYNASLLGYATTKNRWGGICWDHALTLPQEVVNPAKVFFMYDGSPYYGDRAVRSGQFRHNDHLNVLYVDGHVSQWQGSPEEFYYPKNWDPK
ncbi:MAG: prepilin-type N-terminal cleavage/methylation domain-containing protein [Verrucomicrobiota bacterium JB024]|nr:prepilin-type N-terminal cleavage/methylation domain-containing protein [Verrucomicrobiota bacterium JB024]